MNCLPNCKSKCWKESLQSCSSKLMFLTKHAICLSAFRSGWPLNSQEKRDAWPGNFTEYILKLAGKPQIARYSGHDFFRVVMKVGIDEIRSLVRFCCP